MMYLALLMPPLVLAVLPFADRLERWCAAVRPAAGHARATRTVADVPPAPADLHTTSGDG
jgi:hypothetical protein